MTAGSSSDTGPTLTYVEIVTYFLLLSLSFYPFSVPSNGVAAAILSITSNTHLIRFIYLATYMYEFKSVCVCVCRLKWSWRCSAPRIRGRKCALRE